MLTLTQPVVQGEDWAQAHGRLMKQWRGFWRDKRTRKKIRGCLRRIETTWSWKHKGWHVHMHVAYAGSFWRTEDLSEVWSSHGAGKIVDAREVYRSAELFKYLMKTAKAGSGSLVEYAVQSAGRRLLDLLGDWRKIQCPDDELDEDYFEVDRPTLERAVAKPMDARWILNGILDRFDDPEPDELARWAARVLARREEKIGKLADREAERYTKEHKRRIRNLAKARSSGLLSQA